MGWTDAFHGATLVSATGVNNEDLIASVTMGGETFKDVPGGTATWSFANGNYHFQSDSVAIVITKANATVVVTPYTATYDGLPHTATVTSITGVNGETGASRSCAQHGEPIQPQQSQIAVIGGQTAVR